MSDAALEMETDIAAALYSRSMSSQRLTSGALLTLCRIAAETEQLNSRQVGLALYGLANQGSLCGSPSESLVRKILSELSRAVRASEQKLEPLNIAMSVHGVQNFLHCGEGVDVLDAVAQRVDAGVVMGADHIGMALAGLRHDSGSRASARLLRLLVPSVYSCEDVPPHFVAATLEGVRGQCDPAVVDEVLKALASCCATMKGTLDGRSLTRALQALRHHADCQGVRAVLASLWPLIQSAKLPKRPEALLSVAESLREKYSAPEVPKILSALGIRAPPLDADGCVYGIGDSRVMRAVRSPGSAIVEILRGCVSEGTALSAFTITGSLDEARKRELELPPDVVLYMADELTRCRHNLNPSFIASGLHSLRTISRAEGREIRALLSAFTVLASRSSGFTGRQLSVCLKGVSAMPETTELDNLLYAICSKVDGPFDSQAYGVAGYHLGMQRQRPAVEVVLSRVAVSLLSETSPVDVQALASVLYGMRSFSRSASVRQVLLAAAPLIASSPYPVYGQAIGMSLYGLQRVGRCGEADAVVAALARRMAEPGASIDAQGLANGLYGMHGMEGTAAVDAAMAAIASVAASCVVRPTPRQLAAALYGLQGSGSTRGSGAVLRALTPLVLSCRGEWRRQEVVMSVMGLTRQRSGDVSLHGVVRALHDVVLSRKSPTLDAVWVGTAIHALRHATCPDGDRSALAIASRLDDADRSPSAGGLALAVHGLHKRRSTGPVRAALACLLPALRRASFKPHHVGVAVYGVRSMEPTPEVDAVLGVLQPCIRNATESFSLRSMAQIVGAAMAIGSESLREAAALGMASRALTPAHPHSDDFF